MPTERSLQEQHPNIWKILNQNSQRQAMEQAQQTAQANNSTVANAPQPRQQQQAQGAPMPMPKPGGGSGGVPPGYGNMGAAQAGMSGLIGAENYQDMSQAALPLLLQLLTLSKAMGSLNG